MGMVSTNADKERPMSEIEFKRGEFEAYTVRTGFHLGAIGEDLGEDELVFYDGSTMYRGTMDSQPIQVPSLRGAIRSGWLLPENEEGGGYVARPAGIKIHPAESHGRDRGEGFEVGAVADEERDLGSMAEVRARAEKQARTGQPQPAPGATPQRRSAEVSRGAPTGAVTMDEVEVLPDGSAGRIVGKFKNPADAGRVRIDKDSTRDQAIKRQIASTEGPQVIKKARATGDVQEAREGTELNELLPDAASSGKPKPGVAGEGPDDEELAERAPWAVKRDATGDAEAARATRLAALGVNPAAKPSPVAAKPKPRGSEPKVTVTAGSTPVGTAEDGHVVGSVRPAEQAGQGGRVVTTAAELAAGSDDEPDDEVPPEAIVQAKIEMIKQFVPGFEWDMKAQWRSRVKKALEHRANMPVLNAILSIETETVRKHIMQQLYGG